MVLVTKDPQMYSSGYDRNHLDRYWTHPWMTNELLDFLTSRPEIKSLGPIWEPAAGRGDLSRAIQDWDFGVPGYVVYSSDIDMSEFDYTIGEGHEQSFLDETEVPMECRDIITNPPYSEPWRGIADDFVEHSLRFMDEGKIDFIAMLLRSEFRCGKSKRRREKFGDCDHYMGELVLTTRPRWDYGDPDAPENAAPRHNFSWFMWKKRCRLDSLSQLRWPARQWFSYMPKGFRP